MGLQLFRTRPEVSGNGVLGPRFRLASEYHRMPSNTFGSRAEPRLLLILMLNHLCLDVENDFLGNVAAVVANALNLADDRDHV